MSTIVPAFGRIRKLWPSEGERFRDHLLRLDKESRRLRFAHGVSDGFIEDYAGGIGDIGTIVFAYIEDNEVHAAAEFRRLGDTWRQEAEAAFSVERTHQDRGIGTELMGRVIRSARNRGVGRLYMSCLAENRKMQAIARKYDAELKYEPGEVIGEIIPVDADYFSVLAEEMDDRVGFMLAVLDIQSRIARAA
ncbi:MAG: GNAT family N-acetyltransferase [Hyphomicrobiaceae bacterium]